MLLKRDEASSILLNPYCSFEWGDGDLALIQSTSQSYAWFSPPVPSGSRPEVHIVIC